MDESLLKSLKIAINQQLSSPDTPYVQTRFQRLIKAYSMSSEESIQMLCYCLAC